MSAAQEIILQHSDVQTRLRAVSEGILRVTHTRRAQFLTNVSPAVICTGNYEGELRETEETVFFTAGPVTAGYSKASGALSFYDAEGRLLLREPDRRPHILVEKPVMRNRFENSTVVESQSVDGARASAEPSETYQDRTAYECRQNFLFDRTEGLYGLGSHEEGFGNLRGHSRLLYQQNMKAVVPVLVSTKGWGILFDMGCLLSFHDDAEGSYLWADCADELDWYFFYGSGSYASAMEKYRILTGEAPMLPRYALGYVQSKERYCDAEEMLQVAAEYRRRGVPLDLLVLDWQSWPEGQWGFKTFDITRFPDPAAFIEKLHAQDIKFMISIWPSMQGDQNADRAAMLEQGLMLGNRTIYNAFDPAARALYWKQANEGLFSKGVDAWWCDCTEPFESDWRGAIKPEPFARTQLNTDAAKRYLDPAAINLYSIHHAEGIYTGQRQVTDEKRVCNLTRSSYAGQHRYATITWSGDVSASWETLRRHVPEGLNFCASGEPYWSTDIGAFFTNGNWEPWFFGGDFDRGMDDPGYRELFVRWAQYAAFLPMMRAHGTGTPREIWRLGEKGEPFYDAMEETIHLRYRLIPYLYSLMAQTNRTGVPMLRVPALVYPEDEVLRRTDDQMLLGDGLLVKPVTHPMYYLPESVSIEQPDETETVVLPAGHVWYELATGKAFLGGQTAEVQAPLCSVPVFVRAGTVLPLGTVAQSTKEQAGLPIEILVFPGEDGEFTLYDDAGDGYGYERGESAAVSLRWKDASDELVLGKRTGTYPGMPETRIFRVHRIGSAPQDIVYDGNEAVFSL